LSSYEFFDVLVVPNRTESEVHAAMVKVASECGAFAILDLPESVNSPPKAKEWIAANEALRSPNAAAYFPRLIVQDPAMGGVRRSFANSGAIAGAYARIDATKGVWAAPAGTTAGLAGVQGLTYKSSDQEIALLKSLGLNALRMSPGVGQIIWGARTLAWPNHIFAFIPVSRLSLFLMRNVQQALLWTDFSGGGEAIREELRIEFDLYMRRLSVQGAFWGTTRGRAYDVSCDIDRSGVALVTLRFATLATGEFISFTIVGSSPLN
jgi:phage tail sheath protein FI